MRKKMNCPACASTAIVRIGSSGIYSLHLCRMCTVEFWTPLDHPGEAFYETSDLHAITGERRMQWRHRMFFADPPPVGDLLDVGCGTGEFLAQCRQRGFSVWGVDIAERNVRESAQRHGIDTVFCGTLADFITAYPDKKFDVITFFEIVEHLADPVAFFDNVKKALKPQGRIAMSVPNVDRFGGPLEKEETPPNHLFRWRSFSLRQFLGRSGFHGIRIALQPISSEFFLVRGWFSLGIMKKLVRSESTMSPSSAVPRIPTSFRAFLRYMAHAKNALAYPFAALMAFPLRFMGKRYWDMYAVATVGSGKRKEIHAGHARRYEFARPYVRGKKTLDAACGFGIGSKMLADAADSVVGIDRSEDELSFAREYCAGGNLSFVNGDITAMPFPDNFFDAAVSFETIEHLAAREQVAFLREIQRVVVSDGKLLLSTPDHYVWQRLALSWDEHRKELTKRELLDLLGNYFTVTGIWAQWVLKKEPFTRRLVRGLLNAVKRLDIFGLRYRCIPERIRRGVDGATTPVDMSRWDLIPVGDGKTGAHIIVECVNNKKPHAY